MLRSLNLLSYSLLVIVVIAIGCGGDNESHAQPGSIDFQINAAGTSVLGFIDSNGDGIPNTIFTIYGNSSRLGPNVNVADLELEVSNPIEPCVTPGGVDGVILTLVHGSLVVTLTKTNDQIFAIFDKFDLCVDLGGNDPTSSSEGSGFVVGGTGKYEDAAGEFTSTGMGTALSPMGTFGAVSVEAEGTIDLN